MKEVNIPVNDIAPLVEIHDFSLYYFLGVVILGLATAAALLLVLLKHYRKRSENQRKTMYDSLAGIDLADPKQAAYRISEIGRFFAHDNERTEKSYHNLFERLEPYKYAPKVEPIDEETIAYYRLYLEIIDV